MYYINERISQLFRTSNSESRRGFLRLDMNENPEGLPEEFVAQALSKITPEFLATYPEKESLIKLLAEYFSVEEEQIGLFNGSDEAIRLIFEAFSREGGRIVATDPTFAMYAVYAKMYGRQYTAIRYDDRFELDFEAFVRAIDGDTDLVFALNPNNPIGTVFSMEEMETIVRRAAAFEAIVVIDEAYHYFYPNSFLELLNQYDNIIILRTFSKLFSLASCRLGIAVSNKTIISVLRKASCSYNVNSVALLFGEEIFTHQELIDTLVTTQLEGKNYLITALRELGYEVKAFEGNFVFVKPKQAVCQVTRNLYEKNVLVKTYPDSFLSGYIRVSTGSVACMKKFIRIFLESDQTETVIK